MTMHAQGKESGLNLTERTAHIWTIKDGSCLATSHTGSRS